MTDSYERGLAVRREMFGDEYVSNASGDPFTAPFQEFITKMAWGEVWARDGLDRRSRSLITLALLTGLGRHEELALHVRAAVRNGLTEAEIGEVLLHTAVYVGVPAANAAFAVAKRVLSADE